MKIRMAKSVSGLAGAFPCYAATIGNFDGVHLGHREILLRLLRAKGDTACGSLLITFDPHPASVLYPARNFSLLTRLEKKVALLDGLGLDAVLALPFTLEFAQRDPRDFVLDTLMPLNVRELHIGHDFVFGRGRAGNARFLSGEGRRLGFSVHEIGQVDGMGDRIGSSRIRGMVERGEVDAAARLLGRPHSVTAKVVAGAGRGRTIGFPTCNLEEPEETVPGPGVYATRTTVGDRTYGSATHVGHIPTFDYYGHAVETHIFGFDRNILGETVEVHFVRKLRDTVKFASVDALVRRIEADCADAKRVLEGVE